MKLITQTTRAFLLTLVSALTLVWGSTSSQAAVVITIAQVGPDVVVTTTGTLDTTGFTIFGGGGSNQATLSASVIRLGYAASVTDFTPGVGVSGPSTNFSFISGSTNVATTAANGDVFAFFPSGGSATIVLPENYASNSPLSNTIVWTNTTLAGPNPAGLNITGLVPNDYVWTLANGDTITISVIPEPSRGLLALLGVGAIVLRRRRTQPAKACA